MITTSPYETKLINFNSPTSLIEDFDELMKFNGTSRTSILNKLIKNYIRFEFKNMDEDGRFKKLLNNKKLQNHINKPPFFKDYLKSEPIHKSISNESEEYQPTPSTPTEVDTMFYDNGLDFESRF